MKVVSTLYKQTRKGLSVWRFCYDEELNAHFAIGGDRMQLKPAKSLKHLREMHTNYRRYGFSMNKPVAKQPIADPWSDIPSSLQQELWSLPTYAG